MQKNEKIILIVIVIFFLIVIGCSEFNYFRTQRELRNLSKSLAEAQQTVELLGDGIRQQESIIRELKERQLNIELAIEDIEGTVTESNNTLRNLAESESTVDGTIGAARGTAKQLEDSLRITLGGIEDDEEE